MPHDEEQELELCRNCGGVVRMMCRQMTGFCSEFCEEEFEAKGSCRGDGEANCFCREDEPLW